MNAALLSVATGSLPASRKIYQSGTLHPTVRVPMRAISLDPRSQEAPLCVYDCSGPYTDASLQLEGRLGDLGWLASRSHSSVSRRRAL